MSTKKYDIVIIGGGPAGLTAALYSGRANKSVIILEKETFGGQITYSPKVENIPGFPALSGNEFAEKFTEQVLSHGADVDICEVLSVKKNGDGFTVCTDGGEFDGYDADAVIIATGARHRLLGLEGEEGFIGNGVSFCAVCDGAFYKGKTVAVVGGGNSALQEAILLSDLAAKVYVIQNLDFLTGEESLQCQLGEKTNVEVITGTVLESYIGSGDITGVTVKRVSDGTVREISLDGVFLAVGLVPQNEPFAGLIELDGRGYAVSDEGCTTSVPGIFVAGDCRTKRIRQVTTAASDGAVAALAACDFLSDKNAG